MKWVALILLAAASIFVIKLFMPQPSASRLRLLIHEPGYEDLMH